MECHWRIQRGARDVSPISLGPISFNFMQFLGKFGKIVNYPLPPRVGAPPRGNPGSAAVISFIFMQYSAKILANNSFLPQVQGLAPPLHLENLGSATAVDFIWTRTIRGPHKAKSNNSTNKVTKSVTSFIMHSQLGSKRVTDNLLVCCQM